MITRSPLLFVSALVLCSAAAQGWSLREKTDSMTDESRRELVHSVDDDFAILMRKAATGELSFLIIEQLALESPEVLLRVDGLSPWTVKGEQLTYQHLFLPLVAEQWQAIRRAQGMTIRVGTTRGTKDYRIQLSPAIRRGMDQLFDGPSGYPMTLDLPADVADSGYSNPRVRVDADFVTFRFPLAGTSLSTTRATFFEYRGVYLRDVDLATKGKKMALVLSLGYEHYRGRTFASAILNIDGRSAHVTRFPQRNLRSDRILELKTKWTLEPDQVEAVQAGRGTLIVELR